MRKSRFVLVALAVAILVISASVAIIVRSKAAENTLTIWMRYEASVAQPVIEAIDAQLKAAGSTLHVEYTQVLSSDLAQKLAEATAAGQAPDIVGFDVIEGPRLSTAGVLLDLTDRFNALDFHDQVNKTMLNVGMLDSKLYAMPAIADVSLLVYNKGLFKAAGLEPTRGLNTWDELRSSAIAVTTDEIAGFSLWCGNAAWLMYASMPFAWANGGQFLSADGKSAALDDLKTVEAVQFLADLNVKDHITVPASTAKGCAETESSDSDPDFAKGTLAIMPSASSFAADVIHAHPEIDLGLALFPGKTTDGKSSFIGGDLIAIPAGARHQNEAWDTIHFILSPDVQVGMFAPIGFVPVRTDLQDNDVTKADPRFKVFAEALNAGYIPWSPVYSDLYEPLQTGMTAALNGDKTVIEALTETNAQLQQILDKHK